MNEQAIQNFSGVDFNPDKYVKEISQVCVGGHELQLERVKIQALSEETSAALKKNVYQNYMQFIETAKEISHLESEMYQLSHLLTEQSSLLSQLGNAVPPTPTPEAAAETARHGEETRRTAQLQAIGEKVEGCPSLVDVPGRKQLHEGDLLELDPVDNSPLHRVHAYLLSDAFLTASWISNRRGPARYKFQAMYELQSLAVVNVRDRGSMRHAFKLLAFPDSTVFQCSNNQSKREWLERLELSKKCSEQQIRDSGEHPKSPLKMDSFDTNPFEDNESDASLDESPDWLLEMPEDLDVCIAQRHFEEAYSMICKARDHMAKIQHTPTYHDIKRKLDSRVTALINALMSELAVSPGKSLQGGLRAARRSVRLLNQLGRSTQACDLFLKLCTSLLKAQCKRVKREGATAAYVNRLGSIFFSNLAAITTEFQLRAFPHVPQCLSGFVVWLSMELNNFTSHLIKQIFMPQASLTTLAQCVHTVHTQCEQLCELGLDLCYQLDGQLASPLTRSLLETRDKLVDAVKMRSAEDTWRPTNMATKQAVHKLDVEWTEAGLPPIATFITGDSWLELTSNTVAFTKLFLSLLDDCMLLATPDLTHTIDRVLYDVFSAQLSHVAACINNDRLKPQRVVILRNANFLVDTLLHRCEAKYKETLGHESSKLQQLRKEFSTGAKLSVTGYI